MFPAIPIPVTKDAYISLHYAIRSSFSSSPAAGDGALAVLSELRGGFSSNTSSNISRGGGAPRWRLVPTVGGWFCCGAAISTLPWSWYSYAKRPGKKRRRNGLRVIQHAQTTAVLTSTAVQITIGISCQVVSTACATATMVGSLTAETIITLDIRLVSRAVFTPKFCDRHSTHIIPKAKSSMMPIFRRIGMFSEIKKGIGSSKIMTSVNRWMLMSIHHFAGSGQYHTLV